MNKVYFVIWQAVLSFVILFIISKILGKKQIAQLEFTDYVIGISIGSIAAQMATEPDIPFYHFIIAMIIFGGLDIVITLLARKARIFKSFFKGKPLILIQSGKINYQTLKKSKLDVNELISQCRAKGFFKVSEIAFCILENSGDFSVMPASENRPLCPDDMQKKVDEAKLELDFIIDGKINSNALTHAGKKEDWLLSRLGIKNKKQLKDIILATYDEDSDDLQVHTKSD